MRIRLGATVPLVLLTGTASAGEFGPASGVNDQSAETFLDMLYLGWEFSPVITVVFGVLTFLMFFLVFHVVLSTRGGLTVPRSLLRQILDDVASDDFETAQKRSSIDPSLLAQAVLPGLKLHDHPIERVHQAMEGSGRRALGALRQEVSYLANIGVISPMIGLLGTVLGLMRAFSVMGEEVKEGSKAMLMNASIGQAMTTTAVGLMVGIPAMALYYLCLSRVGRITDDVETAAEEVAAAMAESKQA